MSYFYKSEAPETVAIVRDFYTQKDQLRAAQKRLGQLLGGDVAPMRDLTSHFTGGVRLGDSRELDVHWCRPDDFGYRSLRATAKPSKGLDKESRSAIKAEHKRLLDVWKEHCPERLSTWGFWQRLQVNTGNLLLSGGIKFETGNVAYFNLGFNIDEADHLANVAAGKPSAGWIAGAIEITKSEYETARQQKESAQ